MCGASAQKTRNKHGGSVCTSAARQAAPTARQAVAWTAGAGRPGLVPPTCASCRQPHLSQKNLSSASSVSVELQKREAGGAGGLDGLQVGTQMSRPGGSDVCNLHRASLHHALC